MPHKTEPLPRPVYLESVLAKAKYQWQFRSPKGTHMITVCSERPLEEAIPDAFRAAIRNCKPVPSITK